MGAKDWMIVCADGDVGSILRKALPPDRVEARAVVERLYPDHEITEIADGNLDDDANPPDGEVYVGCFDGLTIVCTGDVALDSPSWLAERFRAEARGRTLYLHTGPPPRVSMCGSRSGEGAGGEVDCGWVPSRSPEVTADRMRTSHEDPRAQALSA